MTHEKQGVGFPIGDGKRSIGARSTVYAVVRLHHHGKLFLHDTELDRPVVDRCQRRCGGVEVARTCESMGFPRGQ